MLLQSKKYLLVSSSTLEGIVNLPFFNTSLNACIARVAIICNARGWHNSSAILILRLLFSSVKTALKFITINLSDLGTLFLFNWVLAFTIKSYAFESSAVIELDVFSASVNTATSVASCNPAAASATWGSIKAPAAWTASTSSTLNAQYFFISNGNSTFEVVKSSKDTETS